MYSGYSISNFISTKSREMEQGAGVIHKQNAVGETKKKEEHNDDKISASRSSCQKTKALYTTGRGIVDHGNDNKHEKEHKNTRSSISKR